MVIILNNGAKKRAVPDAIVPGNLHLIKTALERTNRNVSKAARELGITRMALRYRIRKYNL